MGAEHCILALLGFLGGGKGSLGKWGLEGMRASSAGEKWKQLRRAEKPWDRYQFFVLVLNCLYGEEEI